MLLIQDFKELQVLIMLLLLFGVSKEQLVYKLQIQKYQLLKLHGVLGIMLLEIQIGQILQQTHTQVQIHHLNKEHQFVEK